MKHNNLKKVVSGITALCVMATLSLSVSAMPFQPSQSTVTGDVNNDGIANSVDLLALKKKVLGLSTNNMGGFGGNRNYNYDVNADGSTNIIDVVTLKNIILYSNVEVDPEITTTPSDSETTTVIGTVTKVSNRRNQVDVDVNGTSVSYNINDYEVLNTVSVDDQLEIIYTTDIAQPISITLVSGEVTTEPEVTTTPDETDSPDETTEPEVTTTEEPPVVIQDAIKFTFNSSGVTAYDENGNEVDSQMVNGTKVTITMPGTYTFDGSCDEGQIVVNVDKTAYPKSDVDDNIVTLALEGLTLSNSTTSPIYVASIDDVCEISAKNKTENTISDGTSYTNADGGVGAIYSCDDIKFKGKGTLVVNGNCEDGIVSKNDIKIWNSSITVNAVDDGIRGKDAVKIGDADDFGTDGAYDNLSVTVNAQNGDGIKSTNYEDEGKGVVTINGGTINITAYSDGITAEQGVTINGGDIDITTTAEQSSSGSSNQPGGWGQQDTTTTTDASAKGIKASLDTTSTLTVTPVINITGGTININSTDDSIHSNGDITITGGTFTLASGDDAIHADGTLNAGTEGGALDEFTIYISKCYEGLEASTINQNAGTVIVNSTDDGYNAAGGADGSGNTSQGGWGQGGMSSSSGTMNLNGGFVLVNATDGDHDGFDSNGALTINGGYYISNGNEPFDADGTMSFNGGVYVKDTGSSSGMGGMGGSSSSWDTTVSASGSVSAGERITITDDSGKVIVSFLASKSVSSVVAGCTDYTSAVVYTGGTIDGEALTGTGDQECYVDGTISGGTQLTGSSSSTPW